MFRTLSPLPLVVLLVAGIPFIWLPQPSYGRTRTPLASKVILVSWRGASHQQLNKFLASRVLPPDGGVAQLIRSGVKAKRFLPIDGALTAVSFATLMTGAYPEKHGITGNVFHLQGNTITKETSGFTEALQAETLAEAAAGQGRRVINLFPILANSHSDDNSGERTLLPGVQISAGRVLTLRAKADEFWNLGEEKIEHAQPLEGETRIQAESAVAVELYAIALDRVADGILRFDTVVLDDDRDLQNGYQVRLHENQWGAIELPVTGNKAGLWLKLLTLSGDLQRVRLYLGPAHRNEGYPMPFVESLERELGFWPGFADIDNLNQGQIDEQTFLEQVERLATFKKDVTLRCLRRLDFDLLLYDENIIDNVSHQFSLIDRRHRAYGDQQGAKRIRYARHIERSFRTADRHLRQMIESAPANTTFVLLSPHGMMASHTAIAVNKVLVGAGLRIANDHSAEVRAFAYGPLAHLRVNVIGREPDGVVPPEKLKDYIARLVAVCRALRDPKTGLPILDRVLSGSAIPSLHLGVRATGDVVLVARPGYVLSGALDDRGLRPRFYADHGYLQSYRRGHGFFFAAGPGIRRGQMKVARVIDVAPTISGLLQIRPPRNSQGRNLFARR